MLTPQYVRTSALRWPLMYGACKDRTHFKFHWGTHTLFFGYSAKGENKKTNVRNPLRLVEFIKTVLKPSHPSTITNEAEHYALHWLHGLFPTSWVQSARKWGVTTSKHHTFAVQKGFGKGTMQVELWWKVRSVGCNCQVRTSQKGKTEEDHL